jgi:hypothetical protein
MSGRLACAMLLSLFMAIPTQKAVAQDALGGAIIGGGVGGLLGGAIGGNRGVLPGVIIGATAGAIIASEGERRRGGYYYHRNGCYIQRGDGSWVAVDPRNCDARAEGYGQPPSDAVAYCMQRFRSYDPGSGTYMGYDGIRRPCP